MDCWVSSFQTSNEKGGGGGQKVPENQLVSVGAAKALGPLLACLESSKVKAGR